MSSEQQSKIIASQQNHRLKSELFTGVNTNLEASLFQHKKYLHHFSCLGLHNCSRELSSAVQFEELFVLTASSEKLRTSLLWTCCFSFWLPSTSFQRQEKRVNCIESRQVDLRWGYYDAAWPLCFCLRSRCLARLLQTYQLDVMRTLNHIVSVTVDSLNPGQAFQHLACQ